jgi:hypothetical protein
MSFQLLLYSGANALPFLQYFTSEEQTFHPQEKTALKLLSYRAHRLSRGQTALMQYTLLIYSHTVLFFSTLIQYTLRIYSHRVHTLLIQRANYAPTAHPAYLDSKLLANLLIQRANYSHTCSSFCLSRDPSALLRKPCLQTVNCLYTS